MWAKLRKHWFLITLAACFMGGYGLAGPVDQVANVPYLREFVVFAVMWAMGVTLRADSIRQSVGKPRAALVAITSSVLLVPLLTLPTMWLLPVDLFRGLFIASLVPCTLASASVWTRKAGGDDSIAMLTTVVTNLACVAVIPVGLSVLSSGMDASDSLPSPGSQIGKLGGLIVAPLVIAQVMRATGWASWADRHKVKLAWLGQVGVLVMVVFGSAQSAIAAGSRVSSISIGGFVAVVLLASAIHTLALVIALGSSRILGVSRGQQIACGISGSQKTLMVGLEIAIDCGFSVVPMLAYHVCQLLIDTVIADRWRAKTKT
ncbi:bile acid:sodium symporter [Rubripirellula amarantea]|nr:bile acid:sodium symporter [Rubripirellula amarantea]